LFSEHGFTTWLVKPIELQSLARRCPKCALKRLFFPHGLFRVNAQKKIIDIWSIYKCKICHYTWNIDIISRTNIHQLDPALYARFLANDQDEIRHRAFDYSALKRTHGELGPPPDFEVDGHAVTTYAGSSHLRVRIKLQYAFQVRLAAILSKKLRLTRGHLGRLLSAGAISGISERDLNRRAKPEQTMIFDVAAVINAIES